LKVATGILVLGLFIVGSGIVSGYTIWVSNGLRGEFCRGLIRSRGTLLVWSEGICWGSHGESHGNTS
jgi:hypothetical protein